LLSPSRRLSPRGGIAAGAGLSRCYSPAELHCINCPTLGNYRNKIEQLPYNARQGAQERF
jgi:hypothetical protein